MANLTDIVDTVDTSGGAVDTIGGAVDTSGGAVDTSNVNTTPIKIKLSNNADNASLNFFSNPLYLSIINRKLLANTTDNKPNIKFYRKRIISLFKDIIKDGEAPTEELKEMFNRFVNTTINYFEIIDRKDIIQGIHHTMGENVTTNDIDDVLDDSLDDILIDTENLTIDKANDLMMKKTLQVASLSNYVISKHDTSNDVRIVPLKLEIDLKTPDLKIKGVKVKKGKSIKPEEDLSLQIIDEAPK
jgi:hypothetical protein